MNWAAYPVDNHINDKVVLVMNHVFEDGDRKNHSTRERRKFDKSRSRTDK